MNGFHEEAQDAWGFADTRFEVLPNDSVLLTGSRYELAGQELPHLMPWFRAKLGAPLGFENQHPSNYPPEVPLSRCPEALCGELKALLGNEGVSLEDRVRLRHGHGHTGIEIWAIRYGSLPRVPDAVVFPRRHEDVVALVELARREKVVLIPFGGGTNVTESLRIPSDEERIVLSVDLRRLDRVLTVDKENLTATIEAGASGRKIQAELRALGYTLGHEPDSLEFSTMGGWIATNASGMKKNRYGNIEELVLDLTWVTADGVISRKQVVPRESTGTDPRKWAIGSEGNFGIITSAVVKVFPLPEVQRYDSVLFRDLSSGVAFLRDLELSGARPASVRLMDNTQFHFGQALKPRTVGGLAKLKSQLEKWYVTSLLGFDPMKLSVLTLVFEGSRDEVAFQEAEVKALVKKHRGLRAGSENGRRGYELTFGIAYIRDLTFTHWAIAESFETSVPWSRALELYHRVEARVTAEHQRLGLPGKPFFTGRFTQIYHSGVCIYFYLGFYAKGVEDPVAAYQALESAARHEILECGGSISHHHGVGKIRQDFLGQIHSPAGEGSIRALKQALDPSNVFGASNHGVRGSVPF